MPDLELHKSIVRQYAAFFSAGDFDALMALFTPDAEIHGVMGSGGLDFALTLWRDVHKAFNTQFMIDEIIAENDLVAARYIETGTFTAPFRGMVPTHRSYSMMAMEFFRFENNKIAERWGTRDYATLRQQLGTPPA